jgi:signal-transduction protein with cAMP-binding, CBS, and nucleotidyltransferase domain
MLDDRAKKSFGGLSKTLIQGMLRKASIAKKLLGEKAKHIVKPEVKEMLSTISPFMFLTKEEKNILCTECYLEETASDIFIIDSNKPKEDEWDAYVMLKGDAHVFDKNERFLERLTSGTFFGVDGPLFQERYKHFSSFILIIEI